MDRDDYIGLPWINTSPKIDFLNFDNVIPMPSFFLKWSHMFLTHRNFLFYEHFNEGYTTKFSEKSYFFEE